MTRTVAFIGCDLIGHAPTTVFARAGGLAAPGTILASSSSALLASQFGGDVVVGTTIAVSMSSPDQVPELSRRRDARLAALAGFLKSYEQEH